MHVAVSALSCLWFSWVRVVRCGYCVVLCCVCLYFTKVSSCYSDFGARRTCPYDVKSFAMFNSIIYVVKI